ANPTAGTITVTAPANDGKRYTATGTATLLVSDGAERTITAPLALACPAYVAPEALGITFAQPAPFTEANVPQNIGFTTTGGVAFVKALDVPEGWTVAVSPLSGNAGTFTITVTTPSACVNCEALILAADAEGKSVIRALTLQHLLIPPHAASTQMWTFGASTLVWSDAIQIPGCNKSDFGESSDWPRCRSYTEGANTRYYYNWPYVNTYKSTLCPSPWRVPSQSDFNALAGATDVATLVSEWGLGGRINASSNGMEFDSYGFYWSTVPNTYAPAYAYNLEFSSSSINPTADSSRKKGIQVRCVK
ncbi:MAG: fibrobacter succinogenes major paralogous domain-containing protein, partial [Prevotellaceae bacterium]|nr:fibrobacter succinogenes major paralogous domain-containing protein [Prevotellaceae bacterium]